MVYHYAQLDENGICIAESWLSGPVEGLIEIPAEFSPLGKKYHPDTGEWETLPTPEPEPELVSDTELMLADIMLQQAEIRAAQREHDETLAAILLAEMEG